MENNLNELQEDMNDEISIIDILTTLWKKRGKIISWTIICAVVIIAVSGIIFLLQAKYEVSKLSFSLNFAGVEKGQYPNGSRFSSNDIIAGTVLQKVYKENNLDKYYEDFSDFQKDISIYKNNFRLVALRAEYASELSDKKITAEGRDKLEAEFQRGKANILANANFKLALTGNNKKQTPPSILVNKVLRNILENWINSAEKEKGINKYRISLVPNNVISKSDIESLDHIVGIDLLRETIKTVKSDIDKIAELPGAKIVSINTDKGEINLSNLKFRTDFLQTFELAPFSGAIRTYGITKEGPLSMVYLKTKLYELERERKAILAVRKLYADTLNSYSSIQNSNETTSKMIQRQSTAMGSTAGNTSTIIPQFDGTFFDKIVSMAQQDANVKYIQGLTNNEISAALESIKLNKEISYYTTLFEAFEKFRENAKKTESQNKEIVLVETLINKKKLGILNSLTQIIKDIHLFYQKINEYSINSQSEFYRISSFTSQSIPSKSAKNIFRVMILFLLLAEAVIIAGVLLGNKVSEEALADKTV